MQQESGALGDRPWRRWAGSLPGMCFPIGFLLLPLTQDPRVCDSQLELGSPGVQIGMHFPASGAMSREPSESRADVTHLRSGTCNSLAGAS